ncbi:uncharacterized membrane protein YhaH (DUF805 family) [Sphingomonas desiccabilis]|nr:uncharacterized membrane protein YhaH (DUF805 family) [Sphingomonas desiccabilis]
MRDFLKSYARQSPYRLASLTLVVLLGLDLAAVATLGGPEWLAFLLGLPIYIGLVGMTYHRLRDANLSANWLVLMIISPTFGPKWESSGWLVLYASNLLLLVPIALGWLVGKMPANSDGAPNVR